MPVSAKIRIFPELQRTLAYARMLEAAGVFVLGVHGRTREQKDNGKTRADWDAIKVGAESSAPSAKQAHKCRIARPRVGTTAGTVQLHSVDARPSPASKSCSVSQNDERALRVSSHSHGTIEMSSIICSLLMTRSRPHECGLMSV